MLRMTKMVLIVGVAALAATAASAAFAQGEPAKSGTEQWGYTLKGNKKVPVGEVTTNPDGSRREEIRKGNCVTIKEWSAAGEFKKYDECPTAK